MALLSNEVQVINGVAFGMHGLQAAPVPVLTLHRPKPVPLLPIAVAPAVVVSTVVLPAGQLAQATISVLVMFTVVAFV